MTECVVVGNGPSSELYTGTVDYACNMSGIRFKPKYLCSTDPWLQYDIIRAGWIGECIFTNFTPLPIELEPEMFLQAGVGIPADYDYIIHNPEQRENAVGWYFYSTGEKLNEHWITHMAINPDYWQPKRAYVCFVPATMTIHNIENIEPRQGQLAPSGAYAMHHAAKNGAKVINIYGFDSVAGDMNTETRFDTRSHNDTQKEHFLQWYNTVQEWYGDVEFIWHMKED